MVPTGRIRNTAGNSTWNTDRCGSYDFALIARIDGPPKIINGFTIHVTRYLFLTR